MSDEQTSRPVHVRTIRVEIARANTCRAWRENGPLHRMIQAGDEAGLRALSAFPKAPDAEG
jgi:hypothetical protein